MARGNGGREQRKIQQREEDSEESDEEYNVAEDEDSDESDESYSLDGDESEEILDDLKKPRRVSRSRNTRRTSAGRKGNAISKSRKRRRVYYTDNDDDDDEDDEEFMSLGKKSNRIKKPRENNRVSYTEVDDDEEFMSLGRESKQIKNPREKKRVSYTKDDDYDDDDDDDDGDDDDDEEEDYGEFVSLNRNHRKKPEEKKRVPYTEEGDDDDDDDAGFLSSGKEGNHIQMKPLEKKRISYTKEEDDDYAEFVSFGRKRNQRQKPKEKKRVLYTEDDEDDDAEFMSSGREAKQIKKTRAKKKISYTEDDEDDDYLEFMSSGKNRNQKKKHHEEKKVLYTDDHEDKNRVSYTEEGDDEEDYAEFMSSGREANQLKNPREEEDDDDDDDYAEFVSSARKRTQRKKAQKRVLDTEEDDDEFISLGSEANHLKKPTQVDDDDDDDDDDYEEEEEVDDEQFMSLGREGKQIKKPEEKKRVSCTKDDYDDEDYTGFVSLDTKKRVSDTEDDDDDDVMYHGRYVNQKKNLREKRNVSYTKHDDDDDDEDISKSNPINSPQEKTIISSEEDNQEEEDENDAEFKLSESDFLEDEDETPNPKKPEKEKKRHKKTKKPSRPRSTKKTPSSKDKKTKKPPPPQSDSDFLSDHDYTISEEEREQMKEAKLYCANLRAKLRTSSSQRKYQIRKGKEKLQLQDTKHETGKQVCGICLSEEAKRTVRGVLNCCRHYFCFSCIMEWSKVESRCPLCKQRFSTITKSAKSHSGFHSRTVVFPVPQCDQVYEPSEEELRGYLDPYESVICTECQHGGEDALMLLCDICDSSAHTFCVGLGREVPEGNWYCDGCRPANPSLSPGPAGFDLNELYVPETPLPQQPPEHGDFMATATTLRDRRRIHRQIHDRILSGNRMSDFVGGRNGGNGRSSGGSSSSSSGIRLFGSQLDQPQSQRESSSSADVALGFGQLHPCTNRSTIGSDAGPSPYACREVVGPSRTSQGGFHAPY